MSKPEPQKGGWTIVALLFFFMLINFADKAVIGLAGVPIMKELGLTPKQFGLVNSAFFFLFSLSAIATGFIVNHIQARWALLIMALIWAATQFPMLGGIGLGGLIACRIVLGAGEGPAYPVALHATYKWFPNELRTLPTAIIAQGAAIGVVLAIPVLSYIMRTFSWHWAFGLLGVVGLLWVLAWFLLGKEGSISAEIDHRPQGMSIERVSYARLLLNGTTLSGFAAGFGAYWGLSLLVGWFTPYLIQGLGYGAETAHWITTLPWAASPFIVIFAGWYSQRLVTRGVTTRLARGVFAGGAVALGGVCLVLLPYLPGDGLKIAMVVLGISVPSVIYIMGHAMVSEFTPLPQRSAMLCINNAVATSAGIIAPYVMGSVVQAGASPAAGYARGFFICGVVALICGLIGMIFLRPESEAARFAPGNAGAALAPAPGQ